MTTFAIDGFFDTLGTVIFSNNPLSGYVVPGYSYTPTLDFDDKVRKKVVKQDDQYLLPAWVYPIYNRDPLKYLTSTGQNRRFNFVQRDIPNLVGTRFAGRMAQMDLSFSFVSNSLSLLELLEESLVVKDMRVGYEIDPANIPEATLQRTLGSAAMKQYFTGWPPITATITDFVIKALDKKDSAQYGPICQLDGSVQIIFPVMQIAEMDIGLIQAVITTVHTY